MIGFALLLLFSAFSLGSMPAYSKAPSDSSVSKTCFGNDKDGALVLYGAGGKVVKSFAKEIADSIGSEATWSFRVLRASCPAWVLVQGRGHEIVNNYFYDLQTGGRILLSIENPTVTSLVDNEIVMIAGCGSDEEGAEVCRSTVLRKKPSSGDWVEAFNDDGKAHSVGKRLSNTSWALEEEGRLLKCPDRSDKCVVRENR